VDNLSYIDIPDQFLGSVGAYYQNFPQVSDEQVQEMLSEAQDN